MIKFGVFTDVHYAKGVIAGNRICDLSLNKLQSIVHDFNSKKLDFCVCLGDTINSVRDFEIDKSNIEAVSNEFKNLEMPYHIVLGNHDLEAMSKSEFFEIWDGEQKTSYYAFVLEDSKFFVLDANYLSDGSDYSNGNYHWTDPNICHNQISWLENELGNSNESNIFIFIHQNLDHRTHEGKEDPHLVKNYKEVIKVLERHDKKVTIIQGHYHDGGYRIINNIEYITLKALCAGNDKSYIPRLLVSVDDENSIEFSEYSS